MNASSHVTLNGNGIFVAGLCVVTFLIVIALMIGASNRRAQDGQCGGRSLRKGVTEVFRTARHLTIALIEIIVPFLVLLVALDELSQRFR